MGHRLVAKLVDLGANITVVDVQRHEKNLIGLFDKIEFRNYNLLEPDV